MFRTLKVLCLIALILSVSFQVAFAGLVVKRDQPTSALVKKGRAGGRRAAVARRGVSWKTSLLPANGRLEKRYDRNRDGYLQANEAKNLLKSRYDSIRYRNNPRPQTSIEAQYDFDGNNMLDTSEIAAMRADAI